MKFLFWNIMDVGNPEFQLVWKNLGLMHKPDITKLMVWFEKIREMRKFFGF